MSGEHKLSHQCIAFSISNCNRLIWCPVGWLVGSAWAVSRKTPTYFMPYSNEDSQFLKICPPHGNYQTLIMETVKLVTGVYPSPGGNLAPRTLFLFCEFYRVLSFNDYILLLLRVARRVWQRGQDSMNTRAGKACFCIHWTRNLFSFLYPVSRYLDIFRYS